MFYMISNMDLSFHIKTMDQEDSKKVKQMDPDVNAVSHPDASGLLLEKQRGKDLTSTSTKKRKISPGNLTPRCAFCGEYHAGGVLED